MTNNDTSTQFTVDDIIARDIETLIYEKHDKDCYNYHLIFEEQAKLCANNEDLIGREIFILLRDVCSLSFCFENKYEPYTHSCSVGNRRSARVEDFSDHQIELFKSLYPKIKNVELKARLADVVWLRLRSRDAAQEAMENYLLSFKIPREFYHLSVARLRRVLQLAKSTQNRSFGSQIIEEIMTLLESSEEHFLVENGYDLAITLQDEHVAESNRLIPLGRKVATHLEQIDDQPNAHRWWLFCRECYLKQNDKENARLSLNSAAECFVRLADKSIDSPLAEVEHLSQAIKLLRTEKNNKDRVRELHSRLRIAQEKSTGELKLIQSPAINISSEMLEAKNAVINKSFNDAIKSLATFVVFPKRAELEKNVHEQIQRFPLMQMVSKVIISSKGKNVAVRAPLSFSKLDRNQEIIEAEIFQHISIFRSYTSQAIINPAREEILAAHSISLRSFFPLLEGNPFVSEDRKYIFAKGLYLGLIGEVLQAAHILIPQIENSLRDLLEQKGEIANSLDTELIQNEFGLNQILEHPAITEVIGSEDVVLVLREFFTEKQGCNFRNALCHGFLDDRYFHSYDCLFAWWFALFFCHRFEFVLLEKNKK